MDNELTAAAPGELPHPTPLDLTGTEVRKDSPTAGTCMLFGWVLLIGGGVLMACALGFDLQSSPYSDVINIGRLQLQAFLFHSGLAATATGVVGLFIAAAIQVIEERP